MSTVTPLSLNEVLDVALCAAREAGETRLRYFQKDLTVETKSDLSPVTMADRESERVLRERIELHFPDHGILGEEFGAVRETAIHRWVLDPIDGTVSYVRGVPLFGVMVGFEQAGEPLVGVVHFPALGETVWAQQGGGAWWNGNHTRVSEVAHLEEATLVTTDSKAFASAGFDAAYQRVRATTKLERTWGDCYGHILVATGRAEIMLDPILHEWDASALLPILEEAGGRFTDWRGLRITYGGNAVSTNSLLHDAILRLLIER